MCVSFASGDTSQRPICGGAPGVQARSVLSLLK